MSLVKYFNPLRLAGLLGATLAMAAPLAAQTASTAPLGGMVIPLTPGADNLLGIPFTSLPVFSGPVHAIVDNEDNITNTHAINFPASVAAADAGAWDGLHYIRFTSGAANGKYFTITTSTTSGIIIDDIGDDLSGVLPTDTYSVFRYWTLASLFPPGEQTALVESISAFQLRSTIRMPDTEGEGINRAPNATYYLLSTGWFRFGQSGSANDTILYPDTFIIIRQHSTAGARDLIVSGAVPISKHVINLHSLSSKNNDNLIALNRPLPMKLSEIGFNASNFMASGSAFQLRDTVRLWISSPTGINRAPDATFYLTSEGWRRFGQSGIFNDFEIEGNSPIMIRKYNRSIPLIEFLENDPNY
jgi:uncharacterized protein (TIGR02597 family)